jgi:hypothetical protein
MDKGLVVSYLALDLEFISGYGELPRKCAHRMIPANPAESRSDTKFTDLQHSTFVPCGDHLINLYCTITKGVPHERRLRANQ